jgi:serine/threonine protein kinase
VIDDIVPVKVASWGQRITRLGYGTMNAGLLIVTGGHVPRGREGLAKVMVKNGEDPEREIKIATRMRAAGIGPKVYDAVKYSDAGNVGEVYVLIMERMDGSLDDLTPFQSSEVDGILAQVVSVYLKVLLTHGIAQNDTKPGNYLFNVEPNGRYHILLADYGIAKPMENFNADAVKANLKQNMAYFIDAYREMEMKEHRRPHWDNVGMVSAKTAPLILRAHALIACHFQKIKGQTAE